MTLRIGLIADTHVPEARKELWPQVFDAFKGVDYIFHGGDVHEFRVLDELEQIAPLYCARGNGEDGSGGRPIQPEDKRVKEAWKIELEEVCIGLTHYIPTEQRPPDFTVQRWVDRYFDGESFLEIRIPSSYRKLMGFCVLTQGLRPIRIITTRNLEH